MSSSQHIIQNFGIGKFSFYRRQRVQDLTVDFYKTKTEFNYISVFPILKRPNLEINKISFSTAEDWSKLIKATLNQVLFSLFVEEKIELTKYRDKQVFIGGLFRKHKVGFHLKLKNTSFENEKDFVSNLILKILCYQNKKGKQTLELKVIIKSLIEYFLGKHKSYSNPYKTFYLKYLQLSALHYEDISAEHEKKYLGIIEKKNFSLTDDVKQKISLEYQELLELITIQRRNSSHYRFFHSQLSELIDSELYKREPK